MHISSSSLVTGYNLGIITGGGVTGGFTRREDGLSVSMFDLADFDKNGVMLGTYTGKGAEESTTMSSVIDHEYLGHGVTPLDDDHEGASNPGDIEKMFINPIRAQGGISLRLNYGQKDEYGYPYISFGNSQGTETGRWTETPKDKLILENPKNVLQVRSFFLYDFSKPKE